MSWLLNLVSLNLAMKWLVGWIPKSLQSLLRTLLVKSQGYKTLALFLLMLATVAAQVLSGVVGAETMQQLVDAFLSAFTGVVEMPSTVQQGLWYALALTLADKLKTMLIKDGYLKDGKWIGEARRKKT